MKKNLNNAQIFLIALLISITFIQSVSAQAYDAVRVPAIFSCIFCRLFNFFYYISTAVAALVIIIAGIKWIASGDDASARGSAKSSIIHAIVGLVIVIISAFLVEWVVTGVSATQILDPTTFLDGCSLECSF
ncbi:MAG: TrbC/VirB2 family protein [Candidatus Altiarchaeota archaeon]